MTRSGRHIAVVVSGGAAISPFTTPDAACAVGMAAGSTDTAIRAALLAAGIETYTSPANIGQRQVISDPDFSGFDAAPPQPPAELTVNAVGDIDTAGCHLAAFLEWLAAETSCSSIDLVAHSMGGLFSRAAIRHLRSNHSAVQVDHLMTLGTPTLGGFAFDYARGDFGLEVAAGDAGTEQVMEGYRQLSAQVSEGAAAQVTESYLGGPEGWNERQGDQLADVRLTIVAGDRLQRPDHPSADTHLVWPHDGLVSLRSALADGVSPTVLRPASIHVFPDVHSIYLAEHFGVAWEHSLTWDPLVHDLIVRTLTRATV